VPLVAREGACSVAGAPIFLVYPTRGLVGMSAACPSTKFGVQQGIHACKGGLGHDRCIVVAPPSDAGIELPYEGLWGGRPEFTHNPFEVEEVGTLAFFRGGNEGFEAQWFVVWAFASFVFSNRVLPDVESQEIHA